jgi:hypothetical protein
VPYTLKIDHENRRVTCVGSGVVTINDLALYITDRITQGAYDYAQLIDAREVTIDFPPERKRLRAPHGARAAS